MEQVEYAQHIRYRNVAWLAVDAKVSCMVGSGHNVVGVAVVWVVLSSRVVIKEAVGSEARVAK